MRYLMVADLGQDPLVIDLSPLASSADAETLGGQLDYANTAWQLLAASLAPLEQAMTGAS